MSEGAGDAQRQVSESILEHRLTALEKRVDAGFAHLDQRLDSLAFVRVETWIEREAARDAALRNLADDIAGNRALSMWALGLVCGLVLTALVGFLVWMAQGGAT